MRLSRRELLAKALRSGFSVIGGGALFEIISGAAVVRAASREGKTRWAMLIDIDACARKEGCIDCMEACHRAHNVPAIANPRHEIKWIWKENFKDALPGQAHEFLPGNLSAGKVPVLCNHCEEPPCTRVCPVKATWRRDDGIVMMDSHRCIGCRYCMAACPYGSRSFNWLDPRKKLVAKDMQPVFPTRTKGVVEKCDLCAERIDVNEIPVCVAACRSRALVFGNLADPASPVRRILASRFALRRRQELGTGPKVYYLL